MKASKKTNLILDHKRMLKTASCSTSISYQIPKREVIGISSQCATVTFEEVDDAKPIEEGCHCVSGIRYYNTVFEEPSCGFMFKVVILQTKQFNKSVFFFLRLRSGTLVPTALKAAETCRYVHLGRRLKWGQR